MFVREGLGVVELSPIDLGMPDDGTLVVSDDPIALTPTVVQTIDYSGSSPVVVHTIAPLPIDSTMIPQQLPTLTATASAGLPGWAWLGLGLLALWGLSKGGGGRSGRSW